MSIALTLLALVVATGILVRVKKKQAERRDAAQVFYVCRQCEHPYVMPNVPLRCRRCDGPVEKTFEN
jgi:rubrerythrin